MRHRFSSLLAVTGLGAAAFLGWTPLAQATVPPIPSGEHVSAATSTSFTVSLNRASPATAYRVLVSQTKSDLYVANINSKTVHKTSSSPSVAFSGLTYSTTPWYYRAQTFNGTAYKWGTYIGLAGLQAPMPTGLRAVTGSIGTYIAWNHEAVHTGFSVIQASNSSMTQNRVTHLLRGNNYQYTPTALTKGQTYYFQLQAVNEGTYSHHSTVVRVTPAARQTSLRVLTYNVIDSTNDGKVESGNTIAPWSSRRLGVAALIKQAAPDVAGIQEASAWMTSNHSVGGVRQIDDLLKLLPAYGLARTEVPPTEHGYMRTGVYVIYKKSTMLPYGAGGHWDIGGRWAAYQVMSNVSTGAKFLFVTAHLSATAGTTYDTMRQAQTKRMLSYASAEAGRAHVRVVYAADFNSNANRFHAFDGPAIEMRAVPNTDAKDAAILHYSEQYNSCNGYNRTPVAAGDDIDSVFVGPGIAVQSWGVAINLVNGQFSGTMPSDHNPVWSTITVASA